MTILDIGCGRKKLAGAIGIDFSPYSEADIVLDLNRDRLPFEDGSVSYVHCSHSLEHLTAEGFLHMVGEIYRVCEPGAQVFIAAPYFNGALNWANPFHNNQIVFNEHTFRFFSSEFESDALPKEDYATPSCPQWGLRYSANAEIAIEFRTLRIGFSYFPEYAHASRAEKTNARKTGNNVVEAVHYHLQAVKPAPQLIKKEIEAGGDLHAFIWGQREALEKQAAILSERKNILEGMLGAPGGEYFREMFSGLLAEAGTVKDGLPAFRQDNDLFVDDRTDLYYPPTEVVRTLDASIQEQRFILDEMMEAIEIMGGQARMKDGGTDHDGVGLQGLQLREKLLFDLMKEKVSRDSEMENLKIARARLESENVQAESERARLESERARLESENVRAESERARLESERARLESERARLESENVGLLNNVEYLKLENTQRLTIQSELERSVGSLREIEETLRQEIAGYANSTTWRVTEPFRAAGRKARNTIRKIRSKRKAFFKPPDILAIVDGIIPSVELAVIRPFDRMREQGMITYRLISENDARGTDPWSVNSDLIYIMRAYMAETVGFVRILKAAGKKVIYSIDDDIDSIPLEGPLEPLGKRYRELNAWSNVKELCRLSDEVHVYSQALYDKLKGSSRRIRLLRALSNSETIEELLKARPAREEKEVRIGYAACQHNAPNLGVAAPALRSILEEMGDAVVLELFFDEVPEELAGLDNVRTFPCINGIDDYYRFISSRDWDIGLAPLEATPFNAAKADNKFREYGALGIAGLYSRLLPYTGSVEDGSTGVLVDYSDGDWHDALKDLILNPGKRRNMARLAQAHVMRHYSMDAIVSAYVRSFGRAGLPINARPVFRALAKLFRKAAVAVSKHPADASPRPIRIAALVDGILAPAELAIIGPFGEMWRRGLIEYTVSTDDSMDKFKPKNFDPDLVYIMRACSSATVGIVKENKARGKKVIFLLDDDFDSVDPAHPIGKRLKEVNAWENIQEICRIADEVHVYSPALLEKLKAFSRSIKIVATLSNNAIIEGIMKTRPPRDGGQELRIGYAACQHHESNLQIALPALRSILEEMGDRVVLELFFDEIPEELAGLSNVRTYPCIKGVENFYRFLASRYWDIGLAPLVNSTFNLSKTDTKFKDYGSLGIAGIYSNILPYSYSIKDGDTGVLVDYSDTAWHSALREMIIDEAVRKEIAHRAGAYVRKHYGMDAIISTYMDSFKRVGLQVP